jgi:glycosyltransferase involved in cell wall biosynthesis
VMKELLGVEVKNTIPHHDMPELLSGYDLLLLPLDFDKEGINFARYSMPTKASEYMASGTPILVFADLQTALAKYAASAGWAYIVSEMSSLALREALNLLMSDQALRESLARKAKTMAIQNEDATMVRQKFKSCFLNQ